MKARVCVGGGGDDVEREEFLCEMRRSCSHGQYRCRRHQLIFGNGKSSHNIESSQWFNVLFMQCNPDFVFPYYYIPFFFYFLFFG
jgi:hypothetical protein